MPLNLTSSPLNLNDLTADNNPRNNPKNYKVLPNGRYQSIFSNNQLGFFPQNSSNNGTTSFKNLNSIHTDTNYDISISDIITYTSDPSYKSMKLGAADFVYNKNVGVFPNNRLIVARRFSAGVRDDLTTVTNSPLATLVSWVPEDNNFIEFDFGEEWVQSEASFTKILNSLGTDVIASSDLKGAQFGNFAAGAANSVPLPGFMETLQYNVFRQMGYSDLDASSLPLGNPNLIRESLRRRTLDKDESGSALMGKFKIKMVVEYEQKFINGIDPTLVYYDIIANALSFGTSEAQFQFTSGFGATFSQFINDITSGNPKKVGQGVEIFVGALISALKAVASQLTGLITTAPTNTTQAQPGTNNLAQNISQNLANGLANILQGTVGKYKVRILGVVNALTGSPSAPWHVTIGNPKRPLLSSGDMVVKNVNLQLGKTLAFNDLPSTLKLEFTLESARNLGAQEIFKKFNTGKGRTYKKIDLSYVESDYSSGATASQTNTGQ